MNAVLYEVEADVATLTLNRAESLNALNPAMVDALRAATCQVAEDVRVRAVIVRGAGDHFMAGGDLKDFARPDSTQWGAAFSLDEPARTALRLLELAGRLSPPDADHGRPVRPLQALRVLGPGGRQPTRQA